MKLLLISFSTIAILAVVYFSAFFYGITQNDDFENVVKIWANFGDFMGGTLNPILAALSLFGLLFTIYYQNKELEATRIELKKSTKAQEDQSKSLKLQNKATELQSFENTFFKLIELFSKTKENIIIEISVNPNSHILNANEEKYFIVNSFNEIELEEGYKIGERVSVDAIYTYLEVFKFNYYQNEYITNYVDFYRDYEEYIGTYFHQIYQILVFIDQSNIDNKKMYSNILKNLLNTIELELLFYHCIHKSVGLQEDFNGMIVKYSFLENLVYDKSMKYFFRNYDCQAYGENRELLLKYGAIDVKTITSEIY